MIQYPKGQYAYIFKKYEETTIAIMNCKLTFLFSYKKHWYLIL